MHIVIKHIVSNIGISLFLLFSILLGFNAYAEQSAEETIKARKALFSKNYRTAKKVQSLSASGEFDEAKKLMIEMSDNYKILIKLFPDNTKEGFKTEALPIIWEEKDAFNKSGIANFNPSSSGTNDPKIMPDNVAICQQTHMVHPVPIRW